MDSLNENVLLTIIDVLLSFVLVALYLAARKALKKMHIQSQQEAFKFFARGFGLLSLSILVPMLLSILVPIVMEDAVDHFDWGYLELPNLLFTALAVLMFFVGVKRFATK